jgi:hypothetical protein
MVFAARRSISGVQVKFQSSIVLVQIPYDLGNHHPISQPSSGLDLMQAIEQASVDLRLRYRLLRLVTVTAL